MFEKQINRKETPVSLRELDFDEEKLNWAYEEVKEMFGDDFGEGCRGLVERVVNWGISEEFKEFIGAKRYARVSSRRGWRHGFRSRGLLTTVGALQLVIPRDRGGEFQTSWVERYRRVEQKVEVVMRQMFIEGVSTRPVGNVLECLCGERLSASKVSSVVKELDEQVREYYHRPLADDYLFLFLDGLTVKIRMELKVKKFLILVAYGIRADGSRELISFQKVNSESQACWQSFLENLKVRGLKGDALKLIVMDGAKGLWKAVAEVYPLVAHQLCWVHKLRNVANRCPKKYQQECCRQASAIMNAPSANLAARRFRAWKTDWHDQVPGAVACLEVDFDKLLPVFAFPETIRKMIRTTNVIERCFRGVRRRLKVMGYFQNTPSCQRIIYSQFAKFNAKWERNTERIKEIKDNYKPAA